MRTLLRTALLGVLAAVFAVSPALAQSAPLSLTLDPTSGPGGTLVTFTPVDNCPVLSGYTETATLATSASAPDASLLGTSPVDGSGAWALTYTIPGAEALGALTFYVECRGVFVGAAGVDPGADPVDPAAVAPTATLAVYSPATFTVSAVVTTTTTSTTTSTSTSTTSTTTAPTTTTTAPPAMTASPTFMYPGDSCNVTAHGFAPGASVSVDVYSTPFHVGTLTADANGDIATTWQVPSNFPTGSHTIVLTGSTIGGQVLSLDGQITIGARIAAAQPTQAPVSTGPLPRTGTDIQPMVLFAATLVVGGAAIVVATRRRRSAR